MIEALATKRTSLKSALAEEGTNFQTVLVEVRKEILIDAIKNGLSIKEIYPLLGYPEPSNIYWFAKRFLGMSFNEFYFDCCNPFTDCDDSATISLFWLRLFLICAKIEIANLSLSV